MNERQNLAHLKPGDRLYTKAQYRHWTGRSVPFDAFIVERLTAKQVVARSDHGHETRFRIEDGGKIGGRSYGDNGFVPTPEQITQQCRDGLLPLLPTFFKGKET